MKKLLKYRKPVIFILCLIFVIALPASVFGYNSYNFNRLYGSGVELLSKENFDAAISAFNDSLKYKPDQKEFVESKISFAKTLKESKAIYNSAVTLADEKKYLEAIDAFKKVAKEDNARYSEAQKKITEVGNLYVSENISKALIEADNKKYENAITFLDSALKFDPNNTEAANLKDSYSKEIQSIKDEEQKKLAAAATNTKSSVASISTNKSATSTTSKLNLPPAPTQPVTDTPITQASGRDAIKKEFEKIGFVFNSDTTAIYDKNGIQVGLCDRGDKWQVITKVWGSDVEDIYENCITVIWGRDTAFDNLIYLEYALGTPNSIFKSPYIQAFAQDGELIMYIFPS